MRDHINYAWNSNKSIRHLRAKVIIKEQKGNVQPNIMFKLIYSFTPIFYT